MDFSTHSTVKSAINEEISLLAIFETMVAMAVTVWLATQVFDSWWHLAIAASVAPFLLLRSPYSTKLGVEWWDRTFIWVTDKAPIPSEHLNLIIFWIPLIAVSSLIIRFSATVKGFFKHPLMTINMVPMNWRRIVLCIDSMHPPEPVAGIEDDNYLPERLRRTKEDVRFSRDPFRFSAAVHEFFVGRNAIEKALGVLFIGFVYAPAFFYRISVKSTAVVWLPLLWIAPLAQPRYSLKTRLHQLNKTSFSKFVFILSMVVLVLFGIKILIYNNISPLIEYWSNSWFKDNLNQFIEGTRIPPWQVASVINSCIAVSSYFIASHYLPVLQNEEEKCNMQLLDYYMRSSAIIRALLSTYTIACLAYLVALTVSNFQFPPLGTKILPWE